MTHKALSTCEKYKLLENGGTVLVALSGGADSTALLHFLYSVKEIYNLTILAAHLNHGIRGEEADRDERFCKILCEKYNIPFYSKTLDIPAEWAGERIALRLDGAMMNQLRQLLGHRAGIRDGASYMAALSHPLPLPELMSRADVYTELPPDEAFEYSNLGAGIVGAVLEAALKEPLDDLMRDTVFAPAGVDASYLPQRIGGVLADAWRVMPPERRAGYDAAERQARPLPAMDPNMDYLTAHGGLCVTAEGLLRIAKWTLRDPAFSAMRIPLSAFEKRDPHLREGLGCFIYDDPALGFSLYGHQGLAYGAVNGLFFRMDVSEGITGFALLTSAASEQREGVITALNRDVARAVFHP